MHLPVEILEHILLRCDGWTLLNARNASEILQESVNRLGTRTRIWEWCCKEEIPSEQLVELLSFYHKDGKEKWYHVYTNWRTWEHNPRILEPTLCTNLNSKSINSARKISSIAVSSGHIAVGSEDGRVALFTKHWQLLFDYRIVSVKLTNITFIGNNDYNGDKEIDICLVIAFHKGISVLSYNGITKYHQDISDIKSHSIYGNYICIEQVGGRMTIMEILKGNFNSRNNVKEHWFTRIYSPRCLTAYKMWNGKCTFLINGNINVLHYDKADITPMQEMKYVMGVKFNAPLLLDRYTTRILRDNVIINIYKNADRSTTCNDIIEDYIEIIIMGADSQYSKKLFNVWDIFKSKISCIFLYGNSFLIGTDIGTVYFYQVNNWKNFRLNEYASKQIVGRHPIIGIAAKESEYERKFYVSSMFAVHEIIAWIPVSITDYDL
ncbi:unnamed protein product [Ceutorhynchus assimilis]|uniref:F-box domain-containing protein n=1 Tax=Ceutorhynchus assimilis TaxID=467358 RepID=A0A9N9MWF0_9CUCU|nr:unnamed protein product [Ceutorhynchus assimilis]